MYMITIYIYIYIYKRMINNPIYINNNDNNNIVIIIINNLINRLINRFNKLIIKRSNHPPNVLKHLPNPSPKEYQILHQVKIYLINQFRFAKIHCTRVVLKSRGSIHLVTRGSRKKTIKKEEGEK